MIQQRSKITAFVGPEDIFISIIHLLTCPLQPRHNTGSGITEAPYQINIASSPPPPPPPPPHTHTWTEQVVGSKFFI